MTVRDASEISSAHLSQHLSDKYERILFPVVMSQWEIQQFAADLKPLNPMTHDHLCLKVV